MRRLVATSACLLVSATLCVDALAEVGRSVGSYSRGRLVSGAALAPEGPAHYLTLPAWCYVTPRWRGHYPDLDRAANSFGHPRVVAAVEAVARAVQRRHPDAPRLPVGELSNRRGGEIPFHLSHQNGLDVDVAFLQAPMTDGDARHPVPLCGDARRFERRDAAGGRWEVDPAFPLRWNWALAAEFAARREVKVIFVGGLLKKALGRWARAAGVPERERRRTMAKLHAVFCRAPAGVTLDSYRNNFCPHDDHLHVRFRCPPGSPGCRERR